MNELYKILDRQVGAFEQLASNDYSEPAVYRSDRHQLAKYEHNLQGRGALLLASYERMAAKALSYCGEEDIKMAFNAQIKTFRSQKHNLLKCFVNDVETINDLCIAEVLKYDGVSAVFNEIAHSCHIRSEISTRRENLSAELTEQYEKIRLSPFIAHGRCGHFRSDFNTQQTAAFTTSYVTATKAKREHLMLLAANFECYEQLLMEKLRTMQKQSLCAATDAEAMESFNAQVRAFTARAHNVLMCFQTEIQMGNALCMTTELETEGVTEIFVEIEDPCNARQQIESRSERLEQELAVLHDNLFKSPFYLMELKANTASVAQTPDTQKIKAAEQAPPRAKPG
ncbi:hypothetical protein [Methylomonas sp. MgM2]